MHSYRRRQWPNAILRISKQEQHRFRSKELAVGRQQTTRPRTAENIQHQCESHGQWHAAALCKLCISVFLTYFWTGNLNCVVFPTQLTKTFVIEVVNENESPISVTLTDSNGQLSFSLNSPEVNENSAIGTAVGTIEARDPDAGEKIVFTLTDSANGLFNISTVSQGSCSSVSGIQVNPVWKRN